MKRFILVLLLALSFSAHAVDVQQQLRAGSITLHDTPCTSVKVLSQIHADRHALFQSATLIWEGKPMDACWTIAAEAPTDAFLLDETGDYGLLPLSGFKPVDGI